MYSHPKLTIAPRSNRPIPPSSENRFDATARTAPNRRFLTRDWEAGESLQISDGYLQAMAHSPMNPRDLEGERSSRPAGVPSCRDVDNPWHLAASKATLPSRACLVRTSCPIHGRLARRLSAWARGCPHGPMCGRPGWCESRHRHVRAMSTRGGGTCLWRAGVVWVWI